MCVIITGVNNVASADNICTDFNKHGAFVIWLGLPPVAGVY